MIQFKVLYHFNGNRFNIVTIEQKVEYSEPSKKSFVGLANVVTWVVAEKSIIFRIALLPVNGHVNVCSCKLRRNEPSSLLSNIFMLMF